MSYADRKQSLLVDLASVQRLAVAFSGGVDSSVLLHAARAVLGDGALGVIADSPSLPRRELEQAREVARWIGARLVVVPTDEGDDPDYVANLGDRCYFCKRTLFGALERVSAAGGFGGTTSDASVPVCGIATSTTRRSPPHPTPR